MSRQVRMASGLALVLMIAGLGYAAQGTGPAAADPGGVARLATAREALKAIEQMRMAGQHLEASRQYLWSRRLMEAERDAAATKNDRAAAAKGHVDRMERLLRDSRLQLEHAEVSRLEHLEIQFHYHEAVSWLAREQGN